MYNGLDPTSFSTGEIRAEEVPLTINEGIVGGIWCLHGQNLCGVKAVLRKGTEWGKWQDIGLACFYAWRIHHAYREYLYC